jgi:spore coat protein CotH
MSRLLLLPLALSVCGAVACAPTVPYDVDEDTAEADADTDTDTDVDVDTDTDGILDTDDEIEDLEGVVSDSDALFQDDVIPVFYLELTSENYDSLASDPYEYTPVTMIFEGVTYGPVGLRTKGENSWRPFRQKSSLKIDINRYDDGPDRFMGMKGLTFQGMNEDYSMMHERVAYKMYREAGVPAARANHALIYVNDELYGLFTLIDTIDDIFLARWYADPTGPMWEQHDGDYTDDYVQNDIYFQHEEGEDDRTALQAVADALEVGGADAVAEAGEHLDWDQFHNYWASGGIVMNFDAYPFRFAGDDCHVYVDQATGKINYIPHGADETFYYNENFESRANGHLSARCREVPECRDAFANKVYDVLEIAEDIDIAAYAQAVATQIEPWAQADPNRNYNMDYVYYYQDDMISMLENRRASVDAFIGGRP